MSQLTHELEELNMSHEPSPSVPRRILIAEDQDEVGKAFRRVLGRVGFEVEVVGHALDALSRIAERPPDVLISDIGLPDLTGTQLLAIVREVSPELPVILITGNPRVDSAIAAVEHGAVAYLVKPTEPSVLVATVERALTLSQLAATRREATSLPPSDGALANMALTFERALEQLYVVYQPIVAGGEQRIIGYEVLARTGEPALRSPIDLFGVAETLRRVHDLGRAIRRLAVQPVSLLGDAELLFVNVHPQDLLDEDLFNPDSPFATQAKRIVLEITERSRLDDVDDLHSRVGRLRKLGFRLAIDDIGAGYSGLTSFAHVEPDVVKIDMSLVREIEQSAVKQSIVTSLVKLCGELGVSTVAEGVETRAEQKRLQELGCDWLQGYCFARPDKPFPSVRWSG